MLRRSQGPLAGLQAASTTSKPNCPIPLRPTGLLPMRCNDLARHWHQLRRINGMTEIHQRITILGIRLPLLGEGKDHPVHGGLEQTVRPIAQQIANVDQDRREGECVGLVAWDDGNGGPGSLWREDFETRLAGPLEEEGYAAVVGVGARSDVLVVFVGCRCWGEDGWVVEVAEDAARGAQARVVAGGEEVFGDLVGGWVSICTFYMGIW